MTTEEIKETKEGENTQQVENDDDNEVDEKGHKTSKGEKKFKKAIAKMGMKPVEGIERVTLKTQKDVRPG
jgi:hypothetical protein